MDDLQAALTVHRGVTGRFASHLAQVPDGSARVPHLDWTVGELGAHVLSGLRAYTRGVAEGVPMWPEARGGDAGNRALIDATPERTPAEVAAAVPGAVDGLHTALAAGGGPVPAWGDIRISPADVAGIHTGDIAVHGWDLARATGRPWRIERVEALTALRVMLRIAPHYVDEDAARGFGATYAVKLRGGSAWGARFDAGALEVTEGAPARADCRLAADPVTFLLLAYGRIPLWRAAVSLRAVAYGRRPWLALRFTGLLDAP